VSSLLSLIKLLGLTSSNIFNVYSNFRENAEIIRKKYRLQSMATFYLAALFYHYVKKKQMTAYFLPLLLLSIFDIVCGTRSDILLYALILFVTNVRLKKKAYIMQLSIIMIIVLFSALFMRIFFFAGDKHATKLTVVENVVGVMNEFNNSFITLPLLIERNIYNDDSEYALLESFRWIFPTFINNIITANTRFDNMTVTIAQSVLHKQTMMYTVNYITQSFYFLGFLGFPLVVGAFILIIGFDAILRSDEFLLIKIMFIYWIRIFIRVGWRGICYFFYVCIVYLFIFVFHKSKNKLSSLKYNYD
jgi:hypothetical protein